MNSLKHKYDVSLNINDATKNVDRSTYFKDSQQIDNDFDCLGTLGSAGSFGGTLGSLGCFGCCC